MELPEDECPACPATAEPDLSARDQAEEDADADVAQEVALDHEIEFAVPTGPAPRRSDRIASRVSSEAPSDQQTRRPIYKPVTQRCYSDHLKKGFGCAAESAMHLPEYYNSLDPVFKLVFRVLIVI